MLLGQPKNVNCTLSSELASFVHSCHCDSNGMGWTETHVFLVKTHVSGVCPS
jgi:hypothetical protein